MNLCGGLGSIGSDFNLRPPGPAAASALPPKPLPLPPSLAPTSSDVELSLFFFFFSPVLLVFIHAVTVNGNVARHRNAAYVLSGLRRKSSERRARSGPLFNIQKLAIKEHFKAADSHRAVGIFKSFSPLA